METVKSKIHDACVHAQKMGREIVNENGHVKFIAEEKCWSIPGNYCNPLEAVSTWVDEATGDFEKDVADFLGVSKDFIAGYILALEKGW